jgi:hypothetical protein
MKIFKTVIYTLMVLTVFSCNTNEEIIEVDNTKEVNENVFSREMIDGAIVFNYSRIFIEYEKGTTERKKQAIRNKYTSELVLHSWVQCSLNTNAEIWTVALLSSSEFIIQYKDPIEGEDEVEKAIYEQVCN